jgi:hypothetical protein
MSRYSRILILLSVLLVLMACRIPFLSPRGERATPTVPAVQKPTAEPSEEGPPLLPTETEVPTSLPPTDIPEPTETPAPASLNESGPYVLFKSPGGIWISNPDGSFLTQVTDLEFQGDLRRALSPSGRRLALVVTTPEGQDLVLVDLPGGETKTVAHLVSITPDESANAVSPKSFIVYAVRDYNSLAWQPGDDRFLAFTGAMDGPTADLYLYDAVTGDITRLTSGPSQAVEPAWSPDGRYVIHFGVSWVPPLGGAIGAANRLDGAWSVRVSDREVIPLAKPKGTTHPNFAGWLDETHFLTYDSDETCFSQKLRGVDVTGGKPVPVMDFSFYYQVALSPEGTLIFSGAPGCANSPGEGIFLFSPGQDAPLRINEKRAYEVEWMPESQVFNAYPEGLFSSDGQTRYDPPVYDNSFDPAISMNGEQAWQVIENRKGRVMLSASGGDWKNILDGMVDALIWDPINGETLLMVLDDGTLYAASGPDFKPRAMGSLPAGVNQVIWGP